MPLERAKRQELVSRYAAGELSVRDLRDAGHIRMIEILSDLDELGLRPPLADMVGPNVETRRRGIKRLTRLLRP